MDLEKDALNYIFEQLKSKACLKQQVYRNLQEVFAQMRAEAKSITETLAEMMNGINEEVLVEFEEAGEFEFRVKFGGDALVFYMQSNVITFNQDFPVMQSAHVQEDPERRYFGHITIYNFLADSLKYNRLEDPGYLIARLLVNKENHFFLEGVGQMNFLFQDIDNNRLTKDWVRLIIEKSMAAAIDNDLIGPPYPAIQNILLQQKIMENMAAVRGEKIGFEMSFENKIDG